MSIDLRSGVRSEWIPGATAFDRQAARFLPDARARDADPVAIRDKAQQEEADGFDSALVTVYSAWADPWLVAGWALVATQRLRVTVAHRPGAVQPTVAARSLATLDRLSHGRAGVHIVIGSSDVDVARDGDFLPKADRYRRAAEYLETFTRALEAPQPFDFDGEFYQVRDAWTGFRPLQHPRPPISLGGSSAAAQELAARYADIYAGAFATPERTAAIIVEVEALGPTRPLRYWKHFKIILGEDDETARRKADSLRERGAQLLLERAPAERSGSAQTARDRERDDVPIDVNSRDRALHEHHRAFDQILVGSIETVARHIDRFRVAGIDIVQIEASTEDGEDRDLRRRLLARLRGEWT